jgi:hypothetical protein
MVMRPSRRRTLGIRRGTSPPDCAGRDADETFEGSTERGLGLVAESAREIAKRRVVFLEPRQGNAAFSTAPRSASPARRRENSEAAFRPLLTFLKCRSLYFFSSPFSMVVVRRQFADDSGRHLVARFRIAYEDVFAFLEVFGLRRLLLCPIFGVGGNDEGLSDSLVILDLD